MSQKISNTDLILNPDGSIYHLNLKPEHISDLIVAVGDPGRVHKVSQYFDDVDFEMNKREFITHVGKYKGKKITVISSGMGTDNVEILMTELDALVNIDLKTREPKARKKKLKIVRIGTSGSIQEDVRLGTHLLSEYAIGMDPLMLYYDLEQNELEQQLAEKIREETGIQHTPYAIRGSQLLIEHFKDIGRLGNTVTCHGFYAPQARTLRVPIKHPDLIEKLNYFHHNGIWMTNLEMETAGYYALARILGHEVISLNAIIANRIRDKYSKDPARVIDLLIRKVLDKLVQL